MIAVKDPEFDTRLLTGIQVALRTARELGYPVERMDVTASVTQEICSVHFAPLPQPGTIATGGDLSVKVDPQRQEVVGFHRGQ